MEIAKALILVDGRDGRRPPTPSFPGVDPLFPIANRPILFHHLHELRRAGVLEATILAHEGAGDAIAAAVRDGRDWGLLVRHDRWDAAAGLHHALRASRDFIVDEPVLVQRAGTLIDDRVHAHIATFAREGLDALALRMRASTADSDSGYLLSPRAISILMRRGAVDNPVAGVEADGGRVRVESVDGCMPCEGGVEALLDSNRRVLERLPAPDDRPALDRCTVQGAVVIHPTAEVERSLLRGPLIVGPHARIADAYIGPYTSIGAGAVVEGSEIEHSIVLAQARIEFVGTRLESSVIGRGARVGRSFDVPGAIRMSVGDGAEVVLR